MIESLLILGCNILILGLNLKLYTEILKDKSQDNRHKSAGKGGE